MNMNIYQYFRIMYFIFYLCFKIKNKILETIDNRLILINESGLYSLILSSNMEKAKLFKKWITKEVLPSIRKYGVYKIVKEKDDTINLLSVENNDLKNMLQDIKNQNNQIINQNNTLINQNNNFSRTHPLAQVSSLRNFNNCRPNRLRYGIYFFGYKKLPYPIGSQYRYQQR